LRVCWSVRKTQQSSSETCVPEAGRKNMSESQQKQKPAGREGGDAGTSGEGAKKLAKKGEALKEEMDSLMDEIDEVL
jgi:50S ribosomal subunit-associated GTPase HflX